VEKKKITELVTLLEYFFDITNKFQGNHVTSSIVIKSLLDLQSKLMRSTCVYFDSFRQSLLKNLNKPSRFQNVVKDENFVIGTILDPRLKLQLFGKKTNTLYFETPTVSEAKLQIENVFQRFADLNNKSQVSTTQEHEENCFDFLCESSVAHYSKSELDIYLEETNLPFNESSNNSAVLDYWRANRYDFQYCVKL